MSDQSKAEKWFTGSIAVLTLVSTVIMGIPAFLALAKDKPLVFYSINEFDALNKSWPDYARAVAFLHSNQIPTARVLIDLENKGDATASEVNVGLTFGGKIAHVETIPAAADKPIWVEIQQGSSNYIGTDQSQFRLTKLATTKVFHIDASFYPSNVVDSAHSKIEVFCDGKPAILVKDLANASGPSTASILTLPIITLVTGLTVTFIVAGAFVLKRDPALAQLVGGYVGKFLVETFKLIR